MACLQAALYGFQQLTTALAQAVLGDTADVFELASGCRLALGNLHERGVAEHTLHGLVALLGGALAPGDQLARDILGGRAHASDARQPREDSVEVAFVADLFEELALLTCPLQTPR